MVETLKAPFPWFGGKSRVAPLVWEHFGGVANYVEPFFGSGAVLLGRPNAPGIETVNDLDGFVCNAWRAIQANPDGVAEWADYPPNECDLHARHLWLKQRRDSLAARLMADPDYCDAKIAGWWLWGMAQWIGGGFCGDSGSGPWRVVDGQLTHLGRAGQGVARQLTHLGDAGQGVARKRSGLQDWMEALAARLRYVRVECGDWERICGPSVTTKLGLTGVFLDPPYADEANRTADLYAKDSGDVAHRVREWALANGDNPLMRIALCGYEGEYTMPESWECAAWKACGGYGSQGEGRGRDNAVRERIWFSPACLRPQENLFADLALCDREIAEIRAGESSGPAYLPALGEADWHTERNLIEKEITPNE